MPVVLLLFAVASPPVWGNGAPEAVPQYAVGPAGEIVQPGTVASPFLIDLLAYVTDPDGDPLEVVPLSIEIDEADGSVVDHGDGTITYTAPSTTFSGVVSIGFAVRQVHAVDMEKSFTFLLSVNGGGSDGGQPIPDPNVPAAPTDLSAVWVRPETQVDLEWTDNSTDEDGFRIERSREGGTFSSLGNTEAASFTDASVELGGTYTYRVAAFNTAGQSSFTNLATVTLASSEPKYSGPFLIDYGAAMHIEAEDFDVNGQVGSTKLYTVFNTGFGSKEVTLRAASFSGESRVHFESEGVPVTSTLVVESTGSPTAPYRLVTAPVSSFNRDVETTLALVVESGNLTVDWFRFDYGVLGNDAFEGPVGTTLDGRVLPGSWNPDHWSVVSGTPQLDAGGVASHGAGGVHVAMVPVDFEVDGALGTFVPKATVMADVAFSGATNREVAVIGFYQTLENLPSSREVELRLRADGFYSVEILNSTTLTEENVTSGTLVGVGGSTGFHQLRLEYGEVDDQLVEDFKLSAWIDGVKILHEYPVEMLRARLDARHAGFRLIPDLQEPASKLRLDNFAVTENYLPAAMPPQGKAAPERVSVQEDGLVEIDVISNDRIPLESSLDLRAVPSPLFPPQLGVASSSTTSPRELVYKPKPDVSGTDSLAYEVHSSVFGTGVSVVGASPWVVVDILPVNDPPTAASDAYMVLEDSGQQELYVLENDSDPDGDHLTVSSVSQGDRGGEVRLSIATGSDRILYTPTSNFFGEETFTYTVWDGHVLSAPATVTVSVLGTNDPPVGVPDEYTIDEDSGPVVMDVLTNDAQSNPDTGEALSVTAVTHGLHGVTQLTGGGASVTYTPDPDYFGPDGFSYAVSDGHSFVIATVSVTVLPVEDAPTAVITRFDCEGAECTFDASGSTDAEDGSNLIYHWDFGDGESASAASGLHLFAKDGLYTVTLTVTDSAGLSGQTGVTRTIEDDVAFILLVISD